MIVDVHNIQEVQSLLRLICVIKKFWTLPNGFISFKISPLIKCNIPHHFSDKENRFRSSVSLISDPSSGRFESIDLIDTASVRRASVNQVLSGYNKTLHIEFMGLGVPKFINEDTQLDNAVLLDSDSIAEAMFRWDLLYNSSGNDYVLSSLINNHCELESIVLKLYPSVKYQGIPFSKTSYTEIWNGLSDYIVQEDVPQYYKAIIDEVHHMEFT